MRRTTARSTTRIVRPPALIGEIALLARTNRPATAIAREPSNVLRISQPLFRRVLSEYPAGAERLRQSLAARLTQFTAELEAAWGEAPESAEERALKANDPSGNL